MKYKNVLFLFGFVAATGICGLFWGKVTDSLYWESDGTGGLAGLMLGMVMAILFYWRMVRKFSAIEVVDKAKFVTYGGVAGLFAGMICSAGVHGYLTWHANAKEMSEVFFAALLGSVFGLAPGVLLGEFCYSIFLKINVSTEQLQPKIVPPNYVALRRLNIISGILLIIMLIGPPFLRAFNRSIADVHRIHCASQLNQIGKGVFNYQQLNDGNNPPDLKMLLEDKYDVWYRSLACPSSGDDYDKGDVSYVYRGADLNKDAASRMVLAHDRLRNHERYDWVNVLHADGKVKRCSGEEFRKVIHEDNALRRELGLIEKNIVGNKK